MKSFPAFPPDARRDLLERCWWLNTATGRSPWPWTPPPTPTPDPVARVFDLQEQLADLSYERWADMALEELKELAERQRYLEEQLEAARAEEAALSQQEGA